MFEGAECLGDVGGAGKVKRGIISVSKEDFGTHIRNGGAGGVLLSQEVRYLLHSADEEKGGQGAALANACSEGD